MNTNDLNSSETTHQGTSVEPGNETPQAPETTKAPDVLDLNSIEKFRYGDQEWTPKDLQGALLRQADYTKKTQALAESRKSLESEQRYWENLYDDLEALKSNPSLIAKFKEVYPEKFHAYVGKLGLKEQLASGTTGSTRDPELVARLEALEKQTLEREIAANNAILDKTFGELKTKYPYADEESVLVRAESLISRAKERGESFDFNQEVWDKLFSQVNSRIEGVAKSRQTAQYEQQKTANQAGRDTPAGGATPGRKPGYKTFDEATAAAIKALGGS